MIQIFFFGKQNFSHLFALIDAPNFIFREFYGKRNSDDNNIFFNLQSLFSYSIHGYKSSQTIRNSRNLILFFDKKLKKGSFSKEKTTLLFEYWQYHYKSWPWWLADDDDDEHDATVDEHEPQIDD